ncbi:MAG: amino acid adenylation domain-containing protein [Lachnospiraceae bacterium]|nr:amino acid adenylation domain-containing protein [Lachnospiraceae bacterium]
MDKKLIMDSGNVLNYLVNSVELNSDKIAYFSETSKYKYGKLLNDTEAIASGIIKNLSVSLRPILIYMEKSPYMLSAFWGCVMSRNFYVPLDISMPEYRINLIVENLKPAAIITDLAHFDEAKEFCSHVFAYEQLIETEIDIDAINGRLNSAIDTDPVYVLYTSGSTGVPKGVVVSHRSLVDYIDHFCEEVNITSDDVIANQAPFYFDASLIDIYCTLKMGATMGIVPKTYFSVPIKLLEFLENYKITTVRWVPSAMKMISMFKGFKTLKPSSLRKVIFGAESMPTKVYNYWKENYPEAVFVQIYGPTEITGVCTYHVVDRDYTDEQTIPIGKAFKNSEVFLLDDDDKLIKRPDITGEICVKGSCLSLGYYNFKEKTEEVFVQNPLNPYYPEKIYRTGDLAKYDDRHDLVFVSRKDFQIKHMGHRIELGEIETAVMALPGMKAACCLYNKDKDKIVLFYDSETMNDDEVLENLKKRLQRYMLPNTFKKMESMPLTVSGKIDRVKLKELL